MEILEFISTAAAESAISRVADEITSLSGVAQRASANVSSSLSTINASVAKAKAEARAILNDPDAGEGAKAAAAAYRGALAEKLRFYSANMEELTRKGNRVDPWTKAVGDLSEKLVKFESDVYRHITALKTELEVKKALADADAKQANAVVHLTAKMMAQTEASARTAAQLRNEVDAVEKLNRANALRRHLVAPTDVGRDLHKVIQETARLNELNAVAVKLAEEKGRAEARNSRVYQEQLVELSKLTTNVKENTTAVEKNNVVKRQNTLIHGLHMQSLAAFRAGLTSIGLQFGIYTSGTFAVAAGTYAVGRAFKEAAKLGAEFQNTVIETAAVLAGVGNTFEMFKQMTSQTSLSLSTQAPFSAKDISKAIFELSVGGQTAKAIFGDLDAAVGGVSKNAKSSLIPVLNLATIGMMDVGRAADIVTNIMEGFHLKAEATSEVVSVMAYAALRSNMTIEQMGTALSYIAPIAYQTGQSLSDVSAMLEALHNAGIKGSRAGTAMRKLLTDMYDPSSKLATMLGKLDTSAIDFSGNALRLVDILEKMREGLDTGKISMSDIAEATGLYAESGVLALISASQRFTKQQQDQNLTVEQAGKAIEEEAKDIRSLQVQLEKAASSDVAGLIVERFSTSLAKQFQILKNSTSLVGLLAFDQVSDELTNLTKELSEFFQTLAYSPEMEGFSKGLESSLVDIADIVRNELYPAFVEFYKIMAPITGAVMSFIGALLGMEGVLKALTKLLLFIGAIAAIKILGGALLWLIGLIVTTTGAALRLGAALAFGAWAIAANALIAALTKIGAATAAAVTAASLLSGALVVVGAIGLGYLISSLFTVEEKLQGAYIEAKKLEQLQNKRDTWAHHSQVARAVDLEAVGLNAFGAQKEEKKLLEEQRFLMASLREEQAKGLGADPSKLAGMVHEVGQLAKEIAKLGVLSKQGFAKVLEETEDTIKQLDEKILLSEEHLAAEQARPDWEFGSLYSKTARVASAIDSLKQLNELRDALTATRNLIVDSSSVTNALAAANTLTTSQAALVKVGPDLSTRLRGQGKEESLEVLQDRLTTLERELGIIDALKDMQSSLQDPQMFGIGNVAYLFGDLQEKTSSFQVSIQALNAELAGFGIDPDKASQVVTLFEAAAKLPDSTPEKATALKLADKAFEDALMTSTNIGVVKAAREHAGEEQRKALIMQIDSLKGQVQDKVGKGLQAEREFNEDTRRQAEDLEKQRDLARDFENFMGKAAQNKGAFITQQGQDARELSGVREEYSALAEEYERLTAELPNAGAAAVKQYEEIGDKVRDIINEPFLLEEDKKIIQDMFTAASQSAQVYNDKIKEIADNKRKMREDEKRQAEAGTLLSPVAPYTTPELEEMASRYNSIAAAVKAYNLTVYETGKLVGTYITARERQIAVDAAYLRVLQSNGDAVGVYFEQLRQQVSDLRPVFAQIFSDMESALANVIKEWKLDFKSFVDYVKTLFAKLAAQQIMLSLGQMFDFGTGPNGKATIPAAAFAMAGAGPASAGQAGPFPSAFNMTGPNPLMNGFIPGLGGGGGSGGGFGNFSTNLFSNPFASTVPWASTAGAWLSNLAGSSGFFGGVGTGLSAVGSSGLLGVGNAFGAGAAQIAGTTAGGTATGLGQMAGSVIPYIGWIIAIVSIVASLLGKEDAPRFGLRGGLGEAEFSESGLKKKTTDKVMELVGYVDELVMKALGPDLVTQINESGKNFSTGTFKSDKEQGFINALWKRYQLILGEVDKSLADSVKDLDRSDMESFIAGLVELLAPLNRMQALFKSMKGSKELKILGFDNLKDGIAVAKEFMLEGENVAQTLERITTTTMTVTSTFDSLGMSLNLIGSAAIQASQDIIDAFGSVEEFTSAFSFFQQEFQLALTPKSPAELRGSFQERMDALGISIPDTREGFVALVTAIDWTTEAGRELGVSLLGAAASADAFYDLQEAAQALIKSFYILRDVPQGIAEELVTLFGSQQEAASSIGFFETNFGPGGYDKDSYAMMNYLGAEFTALGLVLPSTREGFFNLVQGIDLSTEAGRQLWKALLDIAPVANSFYAALEGMTEEAEKAKEAIEEMRQSIKESANQAKEGFMLDTMGDPEKVMYWSTQFDKAMEGLLTATTPEEVDRLTSRGIEAAQAIWGTFDEDQKQQFLPQFLQMVEDLWAVGDSRLQQLSAEVDKDLAADLLTIAAQDLTGAGEALYAAALAMQIAAEIAWAGVPAGVPENPYGGPEGRTPSSRAAASNGISSEGQIATSAESAVVDSNNKLSVVIDGLAAAIVVASASNEKAANNVNHAAGQIASAAGMLASAAVSMPRGGSSPAFSGVQRREVGYARR